jgi:hypothetical protein
LQRDTTLHDLRRAVGAGLYSIEHIKRYTTIGTAHDQGKTSGMLTIGALCQLNGFAQDGKSVLSPADVGTLSFRPPCAVPWLHLPDVNVDCFPIPSALHRSINGMLKLVQYSRTWGNGSDRGTSRSRENTWKMPFGVSVLQPDRV